MRLIIDRFENDLAICEKEDGTIVNIPKEILDGAKEQDCIDIIVNREETSKRKAEIKDLINDVFE